MFFDGNDFSFLEKNNFFNSYGNFVDSMKPSKYYSVDEGFLKGNMFVNEYKPYKNYKINSLKFLDERETLLNKIMAYSFAFNDLNLYLDIYPEDKEALELFKKYIEEYKKLKKDYATKYGPLTLTQAKYENYQWLKNPWPWDNMGGSMYV